MINQKTKKEAPPSNRLFRFFFFSAPQLDPHRHAPRQRACHSTALSGHQSAPPPFREPGPAAGVGPWVKSRPRHLPSRRRAFTLFSSPTRTMPPPPPFAYILGAAQCGVASARADAPHLEPSARFLRSRLGRAWLDQLDSQKALISAAASAAVSADAAARARAQAASAALKDALNFDRAKAEALASALLEAGEAGAMVPLSLLLDAWATGKVRYYIKRHVARTAAILAGTCAAVEGVKWALRATLGARIRRAIASRARGRRAAAAVRVAAAIVDAALPTPLLATAAVVGLMI